MTTARPASTLEMTVVPGEAVASGESGQYRRLAGGPGEPRAVRRDLARSDGNTKRGSLAHLAHLTDVQLADLASPGRMEFLEVLRGVPGAGSFAPAQRPQEALVTHALDSIVRRLASVVSRETGAPVDLVVSTGDNIDNAQWNELEWYLALLAGGEVALAADGRYDGVQNSGEDLYWHPDGGSDFWRRRHGFPTLPGLLERAVRPYTVEGLAIPWVSCFGNHDGLAFGEIVPTDAYRGILLGDSKAVSLPDGFSPLEHEEDLFEHPELFLAGERRRVAPDARRRIVGRREFVAAHLEAPGLPDGHGYRADDLARGVAYFALDLSPTVRLVSLDTANLDGWHEGSIGKAQLDWLEKTLVACHSSHLDRSGEVVSGGGDDRLVVLASHHGLSTLGNLRRSELGFEEDHPRFGAGDVAALLSRFPNVVAWLNGHRHVNEIVARPSQATTASGEGAGYYEISTVSIADWPSQARLVEIVTNGDGTLSLLTTMLDHLGPLVPPESGVDEYSVDDLASLHRELAGNVPQGGFFSRVTGRREDRNCDLRLMAPFPLEDRAP